MWWLFNQFAAKKTLVQVNELVELGDIVPENVVTPGIFVNGLIEVTNPQLESKLVKEGVIYPPSGPAESNTSQGVK